MGVHNEQACAQFRCRRKMLGGRFTGKDQEVVGSSATFESITPASRGCCHCYLSARPPSSRELGQGANFVGSGIVIDGPITLF